MHFWWMGDETKIHHLTKCVSKMWRWTLRNSEEIIFNYVFGLIPIVKGRKAIDLSFRIGIKALNNVLWNRVKAAKAAQPFLPGSFYMFAKRNGLRTIIINLSLKFDWMTSYLLFITASQSPLLLQLYQIPSRLHKSRLKTASWHWVNTVYHCILLINNIWNVLYIHINIKLKLVFLLKIYN